MTCLPCAVLRQIGLNTALWLDKTGNTILLGSPNETISQRTARARLAGEAWATTACGVLTWISTRLGQPRDHCTWAMESGSIAVEIWHWSKPPATPDA